MAHQFGCFGSVLFHSAESRRCQACPHLAECITQTAENKTKLQGWYEALVVADPSKRKASTRAMLDIAPKTTGKRVGRVAATTTTVSPGAHVSASGRVLSSVKPREFVQRWEKKGVDFAGYKTGVNPFKNSGNKFAMVAMQMFMDRKSVSKADLVDELIAKAGANGEWGIGTAMSHASIVFEAFEFLDIITVSGGVAHLR